MRTYKFKLYPSGKQERELNRQADLCREMYNAMLQQRIYAHRSGNKVNYNSQQNEIPEIKKTLPEYRSIHSQVLQDVARRLDRAYSNFYRREREKKNGRNIKAGFPRFKSCDRYRSITYPQSGFKIMDNGHVWFSKIGELRMFMHRPITGKIKTLTIRHDRVGDWFVTVAVMDDTDHKVTVSPQGLPREPLKPIGIDMGLKSIVTTSEGLQIDHPQYLRNSEKKLKRSQKQLSRKKKGSGKRIKAKRRVAKLHRKIRRQRGDFSHKVSNYLALNHDFIAFEDLAIAGMVRNHHFAKSIEDASWGQIVQYTVYKAESAGATVVLVNPKYTSQKCSGCGNRKDDLTLSDRTYKCNSCGLTINRDVNAAINILNVGLEKVGRGTPEFTPVEIGALPTVTPVAETGSPLL